MVCNISSLLKVQKILLKKNNLLKLITSQIHIFTKKITEIMRYQIIPPTFYKNTRKAFMQAMEPKSIAVFNSNDLYPISADSLLPFEQHRDIFYLTGVDQEESILLLFPDAIDSNMREVLFVRETNDHIAVWEGAKLSKSQAT